MAKKKTKKAKKTVASPSVAVPSTNSDERWRVESAADTMMRMEEINSDTKLKSKAKKELARRAKAISRARNT